jgi:hypothetical protein
MFAGSSDGLYILSKVGEGLLRETALLALLPDGRAEGGKQRLREVEGHILGRVVMPAAEPLPGEAWAYRARQADPLGEVVVMKMGFLRPIRVLVRFVDPSFEGLEDWVPPARLKVLWTDVEAFEGRPRRDSCAIRSPLPT